MSKESKKGLFAVFALLAFFVSHPLPHSQVEEFIERVARLRNARVLAAVFSRANQAARHEQRVLPNTLAGGWCGRSRG